MALMFCRLSVVVTWINCILDSNLLSSNDIVAWLETMVISWRLALANVAFLVTSHLQFTACKHRTLVSCLCWLSWCLLYHQSRSSLKHVVWSTRLSQLSFFFFLSSSLSPVITDLGWSLPREWSENPRLADVLALFASTSASPLHEKVLRSCTAVSNWPSARGWSTPGCWWLAKQRGARFVLPQCRVLCGDIRSFSLSQVAVVWRFYILISVLTRPEEIQGE